jgi:hypothetical protein
VGSGVSIWLDAGAPLSAVYSAVDARVHGVGNGVSGPLGTTPAGCSGTSHAKRDACCSDSRQRCTNVDGEPRELRPAVLLLSLLLLLVVCGAASGGASGVALGAASLMASGTASGAAACGTVSLARLPLSIYSAH